MAASIVTGVLIVAIMWVYLLATSVQGAFDAIVAVSGLLFAAFYVLTALATVVYYRRILIDNERSLVFLGVLPLAAAGFLVWVIWKSVQNAPVSQNWSLAGVVVIGFVLMLIARFGYRRVALTRGRMRVATSSAD